MKRTEMEERRAGSGTFTLRDPRPGDMGWVVHRHGALCCMKAGGAGQTGVRPSSEFSELRSILFNVAGAHLTHDSESRIETSASRSET